MFIFKSNKLPQPSEKQTYPASIYYRNSIYFRFMWLPFLSNHRLGVGCVISL